MPAVHYYLGRPARVWISAHTRRSPARQTRKGSGSVHNAIPGQPASGLTPSGPAAAHGPADTYSHYADNPKPCVTATSDLPPDAAPAGGLLARHRTLPGPPGIPDTLQEQARRPARTARSLRSSAGCPPSRGRPGISATRWTSAAPAWRMSWAAHPARPAPRTRAPAESRPAEDGPPGHDSAPGASAREGVP